MTINLVSEVTSHKLRKVRYQYYSKNRVELMKMVVHSTTMLLAFGLLLSMSFTQVYCTFSTGFEGRRACPGQFQNITCCGQDTDVVSWLTDASTDPNPTIGGFLADSNTTEPVTVNVFGQGYNGFITVQFWPQNLTANTFFFNSTYSINTSAPRTTVSCGDGRQLGNFGSVDIEFATAPSAPRMFSQADIQTLTDFARVTVRWEPPTDNGGRDLDELSYIVTISPPAQLSAAVVTSTSVTVTDADYNVDYTVSVVATNCAGNSQPRLYRFRVDACEQPDPPPNGTIGQVGSRVAGAAVAFQCNLGFSPTNVITATCVDSLTWNPDPATFECTEIDLPVTQTLDFFSQSSFTGLDISLSVVVSATVSVLIGIALGVCCTCWLKRSKAEKVDLEKPPSFPETSPIPPPLPIRPPPTRPVTPDYEEVAAGTGDSELDYNYAYIRPEEF